MEGDEILQLMHGKQNGWTNLAARYPSENDFFEMQAHMISLLKNSSWARGFWTISNHDSGSSRVLRREPPFLLQQGRPCLLSIVGGYGVAIEAKYLCLYWLYLARLLCVRAWRELELEMALTHYSPTTAVQEEGGSESRTDQTSQTRERNFDLAR